MQANRICNGPVLCIVKKLKKKLEKPDQRRFLCLVSAVKYTLTYYRLTECETALRDAFCI